MRRCALLPRIFKRCHGGFPCAYQRAKLGRDTAAYQGVPGAWSHITLRRLFPLRGNPPLPPGARSLTLCRRGDAQFGVLPFENSSAGDVSTVLDLLYTHPKIIVSRMCDMHIRQDLVAVPGATMETIKTVVSHPQALAQSSVFVQQHGFKTATWGNTADAARHVWLSWATPPLRPLPAPRRRNCTGCKFSPRHQRRRRHNTTRFIVIERADTAPTMTGEGQRLALLFTARHKPGQLAAALDQIGARGF